MPIKLPEPVHEKLVRPWWSSSETMLLEGIVFIGVTIRPFHDFLALFDASAQDANGRCAFVARS